jgi:hypothetical protein
MYRFNSFLLFFFWLHPYPRNGICSVHVYCYTHLVSVEIRAYTKSEFSVMDCLFLFFVWK